MRVRLQFESLKETTSWEYVARFVFGGAVTVLAGLVAERYGPVVGGLFLAFPGIYPAGVTLVEAHKLRREREAAKSGIRSARAEASVVSAGASAGALGLVCFAVVVWRGLPSHGLLPVTLTACAAWTVGASVSWWVRERV